MPSDSRAGSVWAVAIVFAILTYVSVGLRIYVRAGAIGRFGLDDKAVIVAQVLFTAYLICQIGGVSYGTGQHLKDLDYERAETALEFWFFCEIWYSLANAAVKVSICLSLRRVTVKFIHLCIVYGLMIWSVCLGLAFFLGTIFQCIPARDWWSLDPNHKRCLKLHTITSLTYAISAVNVACDWTLALFPFFVVKDIDIPVRQKILVASILAFGSLGCTATVVRTAYIDTLADTYKGWNGDFLYDSTPVAVWTTVEAGVAITAICLATLRPLVNQLFGLSSSYTGSAYRSHRLSTNLSSDNRTSPIPLGSYQSSRANAMAIIDADDITDAAPDNYVGFSQFNPTKSMGHHLREVEEEEEYQMGPSVKQRDPV